MKSISPRGFPLKYENDINALSSKAEVVNYIDVVTKRIDELHTARRARLTITSVRRARNEKAGSAAVRSGIMYGASIIALMVEPASSLTVLLLAGTAASSAWTYFSGQAIRKWERVFDHEELLIDVEIGELETSLGFANKRYYEL